MGRNIRETSRAAADSIQSAAPKQRADVLAYIRRRGTAGATRDEIAASLEMAVQSVTPRVVELIAAGDIRETSETRKTRRGRSAAVLIAQPPPGDQQQLLF